MPEVIICGPPKMCADPNPNRWHCMRGHALKEEDKPARPGVCPLDKCDRKGANR